MTHAGRRTVVRWVALLLVAAAFVGCRRREKHATVSADDDIFTTDSFPGGPVQDGNVADDGRAMSPAGEDMYVTLCVTNGDRGTAMAVFYTSPANPGEPGHLYASHYDGETWTPPVSLAAFDGIPSLPKFGATAVVAFLNTANHPDADAQSRDGDALIAWAGLDLDQDGAGTADDVNGCVYVTYFNASDREDPARNHGFQALAARVSVEDELDEDLFNLGFVSDGLCGQANYSVFGNTYSWGDDTTGIALGWVQSENNDSLIPGSEDIALHAVLFDLGQGGDPELPLVAGSDLRVPVLGFGASDSGLGSEETIVNPTWQVYNNLIFVRVASDVEAGSDVIMVQDPPQSFFAPFGAYGTPMEDDDDITVQVTGFDFGAGTLLAPHSLANTPDSTDSFESNDELVNSAAIYGSDDGLAEVLVFHTILLADPDAATFFGEITIDGSLYATGIDEKSGVPSGSVILDPESPTIFDSVLPTEVATRISRNGDYIWVVWGESASGGVFAEQALRASQFVTTRLDADGGAPAVIPPVSAQFSPWIQLNAEIDGYDVDWFMFQVGLGYVCGAQSDPDVMHVFFEHSDGSGDVVFDARLTADLTAPVAPVATVTVVETFENTEINLAGFVQNGDGSRFCGTDAGQGGESLCVYRRDVDASASTDFRAFARLTGGGPAVEIDSVDPTRQVTSGSFRLVGTPRGSEIGTFETASGQDSSDRPHPFTRVEVLFFESNTTETSGNGEAIRTRAFLADSDNALSIGDRFSPSAGTAFESPVEISLPFGDPNTDFDAKYVGLGVGGDTVGVWFTEQGHIYYQEASEPSGWRTLDGASDPALVDDDSAIEIPAPPLAGPRFIPPTCGCDTLHGALVFWVKDLDPGSGHSRLQVRVRDND